MDDPFIYETIDEKRKRFKKLIQEDFDQKIFFEETFLNYPLGGMSLKNIGELISLTLEDFNDKLYAYALKQFPEINKKIEKENYGMIVYGSRDRFGYFEFCKDFSERVHRFLRWQNLDFGMGDIVGKMIKNENNSQKSAKKLVDKE